MKMLALTRYSRLGASSRIRTLQYLPALGRQGVETTVSPFFSDHYLRTLYRKGIRQFPEVIASYFRRLAVLASLGKYDLVWIEKEIFIYFPALAERFLRLLKKPYVVVYDDAIFHNYDQSPNFLVRLLLKGKIDAVMRGARLVIAGNDYLEKRAGQAGARDVVQIPSVVDLERYPSKGRPPRGPFTIGWIGNPWTSEYLDLVQGALAEVCALPQTRFRAIGAGPLEGKPYRAQVRPWTEGTETKEIHRLDVGIMPLPDDPWERGKCGYKLIQYMACGKPVVASPVGVNRKIVRHGINGFLAGTQKEWVQALKTLRRDPALARRMGRSGRKDVEKKYSLQATSSQLVKVLYGCLGEKAPSSRQPKGERRTG